MTSVYLRHVKNANWNRKTSGHKALFCIQQISHPTYVYIWTLIKLLIRPQPDLKRCAQWNHYPCPVHFLQIFSVVCVTGWEKCAVALGLEPMISPSFWCSTYWAIRQPLPHFPLLKWDSSWTSILSRPAQRFIFILFYATRRDTVAIAVSKYHRVRKMYSRPEARTRGPQMTVPMLYRQSYPAALSHLFPLWPVRGHLADWIRTLRLLTGRLWFAQPSAVVMLYISQSIYCFPAICIQQIDCTRSYRPGCIIKDLRTQ